MEGMNKNTLHADQIFVMAASLATFHKEQEELEAKFAG